MYKRITREKEREKGGAIAQINGFVALLTVNTTFLFLSIFLLICLIATK